MGLAQLRPAPVSPLRQPSSEIVVIGSQQLHAFFDRVKEECRHGQVLVAYDYVADIHLLDAALGGRDANTSARPLFNVFNLQLLGEEFNRTVERLFSATDKQPHADTTRSSMRG
jgi:hypothetical protein